MTSATTNSREAILAAAKSAAQAHGYNGLNFRDLAARVGIRSASLYYHFPSKADLGAAVARRYWEDTAAQLDALAEDPREALRGYPDLFRLALQNDNRMCLVSHMAAEYDDLPEAVRQEVQAFIEVNLRWLERQLTAAGLAPAGQGAAHAQAIYAAIAGAQLLARGRADLALYDSLIESYRAAGLLPA